MIKPEIAVAALSATVEREAGTRWRAVVRGWAVVTRTWFQVTLLAGLGHTSHLGDPRRAVDARWRRGRGAGRGSGQLGYRQQDGGVLECLEAVAAVRDDEQVSRAALP